MRIANVATAVLAAIVFTGFATPGFAKQQQPKHQQQVQKKSQLQQHQYSEKKKSHSEQERRGRKSKSNEGWSFGCHDCVPTIIGTLVNSGSHDYPFPSRIGRFVGHFDENGTPQSIITPAETNMQYTEVPCEEPVKVSKKSKGKSQQSRRRN